jgi:membrane fusion protein (multidrug efflux system)
LPLDVIIGAIVIPTQAVIPVQNGKKFLFLILEKRGSHGRNCNKNRCFLLILSGLKAGDTVITSGVMALKNETPVKVIIK